MIIAIKIKIKKFSKLKTLLTCENIKKVYDYLILILIEKFHFQKENKNYTTNLLKKRR